MPKITLSDILSGYNLEEAYNSNNDAIEEALENTLSRDGAVPNHMLADFDMNSYRIVNLTYAVSDSEPVTLAQFVELTSDLKGEDGEDGAPGPAGPPGPEGPAGKDGEDAVFDATGLIRIVDTLPTLPDAEYPDGTIIAVDGVLYENKAGTWEQIIQEVDYRPPIEYVLTLPTLPDPDYPEGTLVSFEDTLYVNEDGVWVELVTTSVAPTVTTVSSLPTLPDAEYPPGAMVYLTTDGKLYINVEDVWDELTITADVTADIETVSALPTLPDAEYPSYTVVYLTTDNKLYKNPDNASWVAVVNTDDIEGQIDNAQIAGVDASKLSGTITETQIADDAITTPKINAGAITAAEIATGAVLANKIAADAVTAGKIAALAVEAGNIAADAISAGNIQAGAIGVDQLAANAVTADKIATNAITAGKVNAGAITADKIGALAVTADKIASNAITTAKISAGAVDADRIAANAITANKLATNSVTTDALAANSITAASGVIADLAVTNAKIQTLTVGKLSSGTLNADIEVGTGRIIWDNNTYMKVTGIGFGSSNQFIEWFGPSFSDLNNCTEANAIQYLKTNGDAYFGGALSAGVLKNAAETTDISNDAEVTVGPFGTNGGSKTYNLSYSFSQVWTTSTQQSFSNPSATVRLYRSIGGGAESLQTTLNVNGTFSSIQVSPGLWQNTHSMSGSTTATDTNTSTSNFELRAALESRSPGSATAGSIQQKITVISTEE